MTLDAKLVQKIDELRFPELPSSWCWASIGELGEVRLGRQRSPKNRSNKYPTKYLRAANITWDGIDLADVLEMEFKPEERETYRLHAGDVLLSEASGSPDEVGKPAIWRDTNGECYCFQNTVIRFRPLDAVEAKFAHQMFMHFARNGVFARVGKGVGIHHLSASRFSQLPFPVPPLKEQRRIVAKIDELFSDLDAGVAALERAKANLKRYRAAVLKAAVEGKLTQQWRADHPDVEPATELLDRILTERRHRWKQDQLAKYEAKGKQPPKNWKDKYKEPAEPDIEGLPELPEGWCWASIEQLVNGEPHSIKAGPFGSSLKKAFYVDHGYKIYGQEQVIRGDPYYGDYYIDVDRFKTLESCAVRPRDLLISLVGTIGRTLVLPADIEPGIINPRLIKVSLDERVVSSEFVQLYLRTTQVRQVFKLLSHGGTMDVLNMATLKALAFPVPPVTEQDAIMQEVDASESVVVSNEHMIESSLTRASRLRQSILKRAFEGHLVPQDPNDELATDLLARINSERDAGNANSTKTQTGPTKRTMRQQSRKS